jgi:protein SCO1/2
MTILAIALPAASAAAQSTRPAEFVPEAFRNVGIDARLDQQLPLDARFTNAHGDEVTLGRYFNGDKPVVMALVYFRCPMLCQLVVNGMTRALADIDWNPGEAYEIVVVSFNPREGPELARRKKLAYLSEFGRDTDPSGWHFLTGDANAIDRVTSAVGFRYHWSDSRKEYIHDSAIYVVTPNGRMSKYLFGVQYNPRTLRLGMVEAAEGRIGSISDKVTLLCSHYDPAAGTYAASAMLIMRLTAVPMGLALIVVVFIGVRIVRRRRAAEGVA